MPDLDELTPEQVRSLLRECVTVVRPGEVLILRVSENFTPSQLREYQESLAWWCEHNAPEIKILAVVGEGGTIVRREASLTDLVREGDISINTARAALAYPPFNPPTPWRDPFYTGPPPPEGHRYTSDPTCPHPFWCEVDGHCTPGSLPCPCCKAGADG